METAKMDIQVAIGGQTAKGLQLTDSKGEESAEGGFLGLFSKLQAAVKEEENVMAEFAVETETGKPLPDNGELLPDFVQPHVAETIEANKVAATDELALPTGDLLVENNSNTPDEGNALANVKIVAEQTAVAMKENLSPEASRVIPVVNPVEANKLSDSDPVVPVVSIDKHVTAAVKEVVSPEISRAIPAMQPVDEPMVLAEKVNKPPEVDRAIPASKLAGEQMVAAARGISTSETPHTVPVENAMDESVVSATVKNAALVAGQIPEKIITMDLKEEQVLAAKAKLAGINYTLRSANSSLASQGAENKLEPIMFETTPHKTPKPEMDVLQTEEPIIVEKKVEPFQALRMVNAKGGIEAGVAAEALSANIVNAEAKPASGIGSLLRPEQAAFAPEPQAPLTLSLRQSNWGQSLGSNVQWMVKEDIQAATIRVKPAELGPLNIQISVQQEQLNVSISANQSVTREMLEAALPRLREQFAAQGFSQVNVDISDQGRPQSGQESLAEHGGNETPGFSSFVEADHDQEEIISPLPQAIQNNLLDTFA